MTRDEWNQAKREARTHPDALIPLAVEVLRQALIHPDISQDLRQAAARDVLQKVGILEQPKSLGRMDWRKNEFDQFMHDLDMDNDS